MKFGFPGNSFFTSDELFGFNNFCLMFIFGQKFEDGEQPSALNGLLFELYLPE